MRVLDKVQHFDIVQLDIQVLIDGFQDTPNADIVLEFDRDRLVSQGLEKAVSEVYQCRLL